MLTSLLLVISLAITALANPAHWRRQASDTGAASSAAAASSMAPSASSVAATGAGIGPALSSLAAATALPANISTVSDISKVVSDPTLASLFTELGNDFTASSFYPTHARHPYPRLLHTNPRY
ncbi:hypothetical protein SAICODRAFT_9127 [Saitoella complicata NRRL Y-17804]|uniref:uncharacterized protein n=1 Tax=Saitoella complicata (strain BCRC 22490 / CBS 7301 / JCM 7358 / NBRC 10748 / NRRL Y-17804) TaxID=698492 RepID=UPI0008674935|nr:uncharacterized protein SAICODRAFT_9127 [Saitoella complicata NRRL Y-17804]ODQ51127.1 hypothetical protein SAICODRAFT_9127 [Saitoella complicata NRRL Y-17804]